MVSLNICIYVQSIMCVFPPVPYPVLPYPNNNDSWVLIIPFLQCLSHNQVIFQVPHSFPRRENTCYLFLSDCFPLLALSPWCRAKAEGNDCCIAPPLEAKWKIAALLNTCFEISHRKYWLWYRWAVRTNWTL